MPELAARPIAWTVAAIALTVAAIVAAVLIALDLSGVPPGGERFRFGHADPADAPGLASSPQNELARERREKEARLHSAGWIDRASGAAHIPIDAAMDLLVARQGKR